MFAQGVKENSGGVMGLGINEGVVRLSRGSLVLSGKTYCRVIAGGIKKFS